MQLPELYTNQFDKKIDNSQEFVKVSDMNEIKEVTNFDIKKKIDNIFKSSSYIYKIKVSITLKDKVIEKYLVGKNNNSLITIDNELININDILDIEEI